MDKLSSLSDISERMWALTGSQNRESEQWECVLGQTQHSSKQCSLTSKHASPLMRWEPCILINQAAVTAIITHIKHKYKINTYAIAVGNVRVPWQWLLSLSLRIKRSGRIMRIELRVRKESRLPVRAIIQRCGNLREDKAGPLYAGHFLCIDLSAVSCLPH